MKVSCLSAFGDKKIMPNDSMVTIVLSNTAPIWDELYTHVSENYPNIIGEWKHYGNAAGWTFKLMTSPGRDIAKKRNLLFFVPRNGCFRLRIVLGEKGCTCVENNSKLPKEIKQAFRDAIPHTEGRSIDIDVVRHEQLEAIKILLKIKFDN